MASRQFPRLFVIAAASGFAVAVASPAWAEQFVVAHATYTHSAQTTKDSHFRVAPTPETPDNWASPVDYAGGSVHVRLEVKTKPSDTPTRYQICFEMKQNYCCTDQAPPYTTTGVYEWDTDVEKMWRPGPVDFTQGILQSALILKDTNNVKPAPENVGEETSKLYMPSDLDVTVTVVSAGAEFMPPSAPLGGSGAGGAAGMAGAAGGSSGGELGGASGSGGSGGAPVSMPVEPTGGTAPSVPVLPSAGTAPAEGMPVGLTSSDDQGSCAVSRGVGSGVGVVGLAALLGLLLRRARRAAA